MAEKTKSKEEKKKTSTDRIKLYVGPEGGDFVVEEIGIRRVAATQSGSMVKDD